jgi:hypothetical protein
MSVSPFEPKYNFQEYIQFIWTIWKLYFIARKERISIGLIPSDVFKIIMRYIQIEKEDDQYWIFVPKIQIKLGPRQKENIVIDQGQLIINFDNEMGTFCYHNGYIIRLEFISNLDNDDIKFIITTKPHTYIKHENSSQIHKELDIFIKNVLGYGFTHTTFALRHNKKSLPKKSCVSVYNTMYQDSYKLAIEIIQHKKDLNFIIQHETSTTKKKPIVKKIDKNNNKK